MKRGAEYKRIVDKKTGKIHDIHTVSDGRAPNAPPRGTFIVKNPLYNGEPQYFYFNPQDVEPFYEEKSSVSWFEQQKKNQDEASTKDKIWD